MHEAVAKSANAVVEEDGMGHEMDDISDFSTGASMTYRVTQERKDKHEIRKRLAGQPLGECLSAFVN